MSWSVSRAGLVTLLPVALPRNRGAHRWLIANRTVPDNVVAFFFPADNPVAKQCCAFEVRNTYLSECIVGAMAKYVTRKPELYFIVFGESFRNVLTISSFSFSCPPHIFLLYIYITRNRKFCETGPAWLRHVHSRDMSKQFTQDVTRKKEPCGSF